LNPCLKIFGVKNKRGWNLKETPESFGKWRMWDAKSLSYPVLACSGIEILGIE